MPAPAQHRSADAEDPRITRSRQAILAAATERFLADGYVGANVDRIAADAQVSKRTVYNIYGGKERLFGELMAQTVRIAEEFSLEVAAGLAEGDAARAEPSAASVEADLADAAVRLARTVLDPRIIRVRRLLIGEAERFPAIAAEYYRRAPGRMLARIADALRTYAATGHLAIDDADLAAEHLAYLIMGAGLDHALFTEELPPMEIVEARARAGIAVFLRAYRR